MKNKGIEKKYIELLRKPVKTNDEIIELENLRLAFEKSLEEDERSLIDDLSKIGVNVKSSWDLVNSSKNYKKAIPVLIEHLSEPYHLKNKEGIARALTIKEAKGIACKAIIEEYNKTPKNEHDLRWVLGNTMSVIMSDDYLDDVISIVQDRSNGESRQMFIVALSKVKSVKTKETLNHLVNEKSKVIREEAKKALKKIG